MSPQCQQAVVDVGNGIGASLRGVDCLASDMTQAAFGRLFGSGGALMPALTIILTLYVAFFAFALITGRTRIGIRALTPRIVTLGMVLTLATSWLAYQTLVWNVATGAPDQIAGILTGTKGSATQVFGDKIDIVFSAIQDASGQGQQQAEGAPRKEVSTFSPEGMMWMGATMLLLGTVGVLVTARIALAVLMAVGPVFVVLALFPATRGLFAGWLRGWVMMAIAPLFAVVGGTMILELAIPVINAMIAVPGKVDPRAAMAFFLVGAVHISLMFMVLKVSATMVGNWSVFGLAGSGGREPADNAPAPSAHVAPAPIEIAAAQGQGQVSPAPRRIAISPAVAGMAANDAGPSAGGGTHSRETRIVAADSAASGSLSSTPSRARGIGSRFRAAPVRSSEKFK
ncbi:type IV secretion system protein [Altererythrobacter sp. CC-YST694]|uniref:type IV secretion system protein n=1 Tax=Altererythrobacter sp. CC-YST694 TaxID=2755038 RepID=UPI001D003E81|nr:type IV secretion system protein [Altererythrobacter sp. CC-YST694]MCB5426025.1 type IV secretion system protein [Altererythrobacter sp. CC-YST694]